MTIDKRYQVFISSTFADLKDERAKVQQAIMELECIPAGMEMFPAVDEEQFEFIKKVIDDCDYYVLIIGGRYGSLSEEGISYTEMEYEYAISKGIRVLAFLHKAPEKLSLEKSERNAESSEKLAAFRVKVETRRLVKYWQAADELPALVTSSLSRTMRTYPAIGWVRGSAAQDPQVYKELNELRKENQELRDTVARQADAIGQQTTFAGLDAYLSLSGRARNGTIAASPMVQWEVSMTFGQLFNIVADMLILPQRESFIIRALGKAITPQINEKYNFSASSSLLHDKTVMALRLQFKALKLVHFLPNDDSVFWELTEIGEKLMLDRRAMKAIE